MARRLVFGALLLSFTVIFAVALQKQFSVDPLNYRVSSQGLQKEIEHTPSPPTAHVLDAYPGATYAVSLRRLRSTYSGFAIQVQRASEAPTHGFSSTGDLDERAAVAFCASKTCGVSIAYHLSGSEFDGDRETIRIHLINN